MHNDQRYMTGFGNEFATEAVAGSLPIGQNSPQRVAHGLYAEQLSGTAFTAPRGQNRRSWLYRIRPAAVHGSFSLVEQSHFHNDFGAGPVPPDQLRWSPLPLPSVPTDFVDGLYTMVTKLAPVRLVGFGMGGWFLSTGIGNNLSGIFAGHVSGNEGMSVSSALGGYTFGFWALVGAGALLFLIAPLINKLMHGVK